MRILLIEDDAEISAYVEMELRHEGYAVSAAYDGVSGLQAALDADFDVILLDMMLPGLNGLEVLRRLRAQKQTPVIVVTARDTVMDKVTGLDAGANDYITKPFHVEELLAHPRPDALRTGRKRKPAQKRGYRAGTKKAAGYARRQQYHADQDVV